MPPIVYIILILLTPTLIFTQESEESSKVLVLANSRLKESVELAKVYANARNIPEQNLIELPMPLNEDISWLEFSSQILNPLRKQLLQKGILEGRIRLDTDIFGRQMYSPLFNSAKYLVLCRGTPLRISNEIAKIPKEEQEKHLKIYRTTMASVDAELALLPMENQPTIAYTRNPLFNLNRPDPLTAETMLMVSRLDGPNHEACLSLIASAQKGEIGAFGRAYIDSGGPHRQGNDWMTHIIKQLEDQGYSYTHESTKNLFHTGHRFDAPLLYFGWHAWHASGPFSRQDFQCPPGALLFHLHSFSGKTLRSDRQNWVGPIVSHGAAGTIGNVSEPYLHLTHHLHKLCEGILTGKTLGEAAYYSLPALSWQAILVGDPLYRPNLNPSLARQPQNTPFHLEQYGILQEFLRLKVSGKSEQGIKMAQNYLKQNYGLPLALEVADVAKGNKANQQMVIQLLSPIASYKPKHFQECKPLLQSAEILQQFGASKEAKMILSNLKESPVRPNEMNWRELRVLEK